MASIPTEVNHPVCAGRIGVLLNQAIKVPVHDYQLMITFQVFLREDKL